MKAKDTEGKTLISILLNLSSDEAKQYVRSHQNKKPSYESFYQYMTSMIARSGFSRLQIAQRANISRDYTYKLLNGGKRTDERDYIIALCISANMNLDEIQHALELYPFPPLDSADARSEIIMECIKSRYDVMKTNELLNHAQLIPLRTSPEMMHADYGPVGSFVFPNKTQIGPDRSTPQNNESLYSSQEKIKRGPKMRELDCRTSKEKCGCGVGDIAYTGEIKVENDFGEIKYVSMVIAPSYNIFSVGNHSLYDEVNDLEEFDELYDPDGAYSYYEDHHAEDDDMEDYDEYRTLMEMVKESKYYRFFKKLDRVTDEMIANRENDIPDTRIDGRQFGPEAKIMVGSSSPGVKKRFVLEVFNMKQPEYNEYLQIVREGDSYIYSASHMSCYTELILGNGIYHAEFGKNAPDPEYMFKVNDIEDVPQENEYFKYTFYQLKEVIDSIVENNKIANNINGTDVKDYNE